MYEKEQHIESNCVIRDDNHDWGGHSAPIMEHTVVTGKDDTRLTGEEFKKHLEHKIPKI